MRRVAKSKDTAPDYSCSFAYGLTRKTEFDNIGGMIPNDLTMQHERVDDIPLLIGLMQKLHLPEVLERGLGSHHLHQGISNGLLTCGWLAFILSAANHCKVSVEGWAQNHQHTLETLLGQSLRPVEFSDDRLSIILRRFHDADWGALEADLWQATFEVYEVPIDCVRLDSTTSCGYHTTEPDGVMQLGHSKDHRPDLPQLKLMAAAAQPSGLLLATDVHPGNAADDPLYLPLIRRVRAQVGRSGMLYAGDCKMAALETRAEIASHQDYYLMPLPLSGDTQKAFPVWVNAVVAGQQEVALLYQTDEQGTVSLFGAGYEFERACADVVDGKVFEWSERVQVVRSLTRACSQDDSLEKRLQRAAEEVRQLTPPVGRGQQQYREEAVLQAAVAEVLARWRVTDCLAVRYEREERRTKRYEGRGRPGPDSAWHWEVEVRYQITAVTRLEEAMAEMKYRHGWRVQVTNLPKQPYSVQECVLIYNGGWGLERDFHVLKDVPLGIRPLYVREEEQIIGLTRLLTIALRLLTLFELTVRTGLAKAKEELPRLYEGQPNRKTSRPTGTRMLKAIARMGITLTRVMVGDDSRWYVSALPALLLRFLELAGLSSTLYTGLAPNTG
jgi:transposase